MAEWLKTETERCYKKRDEGERSKDRSTSRRSPSHTGSTVLQCEVLVSELLSVDALASRPVAPGEVAPLQHEVGDDPMEVAALEAEPLLSGAQSSEVLCKRTTQLRLTLECESVHS